MLTSSPGVLRSVRELGQARVDAAKPNILVRRCAKHAVATFQPECASLREMVGALVTIALLICGGPALSEMVGKPTVFAPGVISMLVADSSPSFFPDSREVIYEHADLDNSVLMMSRLDGKKWAKSKVAPFSGTWWDLEPAVAADGSYVIFVSSRPASKGSVPINGRWAGRDHPGRGGNLWRVDRTTTGWGAPTRLGVEINSTDAIFAPSLASNGTLYFERPDGPAGKFKMFHAATRGRRYAAPEPLRFFADSVTESDPSIAPDQSFLIFVSDRDAPDKLKLFISVKKEGRWSTPLRLPGEINGSYNIVDPHLSPDGVTLYFSHDRVIWHTPMQPILAWVSKQVTAELKRSDG